MKQIAITGGKGGTGKSTVAILLAYNLAKNKKVVLVDLDVECPNNYLITGQKLKKPIKNVSFKFPVFDKKLCQKCGKCVKVCRQKAIFMPQNDYPTFFKELCSGCGACWISCPHQAIKTKRETIGKIYLNKTHQNLWLITGLAKPLLEETGPVVSKVKKTAIEFAKKIKADVVLFDTAAGTHCPVISALINVDKAYAITEPTPLGAHDLKLILELLNKLKIPTEIIVNQANLGNKKEIEEIAKKCNANIKFNINYSKKIARAYSKGNLGEINLDDETKKN